MNKWAKMGMLCSGIGAFCSLLAKDWLVLTVDVALFCSFVLDGMRGN